MNKVLPMLKEMMPVPSTPLPSAVSCMLGNCDAREDGMFHVYVCTYLTKLLQKHTDASV